MALKPELRRFDPAIILGARAPATDAAADRQRAILALKILVPHGDLAHAGKLIAMDGQTIQPYNSSTSPGTLRGIEPRGGIRDTSTPKNAPMTARTALQILISENHCHTT